MYIGTYIHKPEPVDGMVEDGTSAAARMKTIISFRKPGSPRAKPPISTPPTPPL
jgi:hypothetical protein